MHGVCDLGITLVAGTVYTVGTSNRGRDEFIELLVAKGISIVIDVRRFPTSTFHWFRKENLARMLAAHMIGYVFLGKELGGYRRGGYESYVLTDDFRKGLEKIEDFALFDRIAIMCAERFPWKCHRWYIGKGLTRRGWEVEHIIERERMWKPQLYEQAGG